MSLQDTNIENQETQEQQTTNQEEQQVVQTTEQADNGTPQKKEEPEFYLDKDGNFQWNTSEFDDKYQEDSEDNPQETQETQEEHQEQPNEKEENNSQQETKEEEPKYKVKIGDEEIEVTQDELLRGYMRQQDYTRKTQALAEQRKQFQQTPPQYQQQYQQQVPQQQAQQQEQQQVATNDDLMTMAKNIAAKQLGLDSADDLSEIDFNHITAVVEAKQALINQRNQLMYRQQNIANLEQQLRSEEPKYDEIMKNMNTALQNLPVSRFNQLKEAYSVGNPEPLREFFKEIQKDYYSKAIQKVEQKKKPSIPVVEHSANTPVQQKPRNKTIDYKKFGHMTTDEKSKVLLELGLLD